LAAPSLAGTSQLLPCWRRPTSDDAANTTMLQQHLRECTQCKRLKRRSTLRQSVRAKSGTSRSGRPAPTRTSARAAAGGSRPPRSGGRRASTQSSGLRPAKPSSNRVTVPIESTFSPPVNFGGEPHCSSTAEPESMPSLRHDRTMRQSQDRRSLTRQRFADGGPWSACAAEHRVVVQVCCLWIDPAH
jgi:hypothetical protein